MGAAQGVRAGRGVAGRVAGHRHLGEPVAASAQRTALPRPGGRRARGNRPAAERAHHRSGRAHARGGRLRSWTGSRSCDASVSSSPSTTSAPLRLAGPLARYQGVVL